MPAVQDSGGAVFNPDHYAQVLAYNVDGTLNTITVTDGANTWVQTYSYNGTGQLTGISRWVRS